MLAYCYCTEKHKANMAWLGCECIKWRVLEVYLIKIALSTLVYSKYRLTVSWLWWRQLAAGRSLNFASCWGGWGERSCTRNVTAMYSTAVARTPNFPVERRTFTTELSSPHSLWLMRRLFRGELSDLLLFDGPWLLRLRSTYLRLERVFQRDVEKSKVKQKWKEPHCVLNLRLLTPAFSEVGVGHGISWTIWSKHLRLDKSVEGS